ncbi:Hypothetical protein CAP_5691 [Chondromyces apiculatus DSM 436]|uniref:Transcriptional regulator n=2 Tax=Chondromyces apiculatus TaxID=51 RepID=A0A017T260_9BACT|nr:Hypothetical protein CAP_5691 [Chondromyces apiculatus DSM 436]
MRRFVSMHVSSIELLEVLLLLRQSADKEWRAEDVARVIGSSMMSIRDRLANLSARNLVAAREGSDDIWYRYAPEEDLARVIEEVAALYKERRLTVINMIYARQAAGDIESFADAFRIFKKEGD